MISRFMCVALLLGLTACSKTSFSGAKQDAISKSSVLGGGDATGTFNDIGNGSPNGEIPIELVCSDDKSKKFTNLKGAIAKSLPVKLFVNGKLCTSDPQAILNIVISGSVKGTDAASLCPSTLNSKGKLKTVGIQINNEEMVDASAKLTIIYALNKDQSPASEVADANCDRNASPLVIHRRSDVENPAPIPLTAPEDGVDFDLLGAENNHVPVRISWFANREYQFLALPNAEREVNGIDELFGDNTLGPDGDFADNGYAALAKYDGTTADGVFRLQAADGRIDASDAVFTRLRLWSDRNFDGRAQPRELMSLARAGIVYIDLEYSNEFAERDRYGNETKMKSVVGNFDGSLDLIFDLWFAYRN